MPYKRRDFIKFSATIGAGLAVGKFAFGLSGCNSASVGSAGKDFGLQLYTLRDVIASDPENILTQIASFGYKQIESYDHEQLGMFMGMKNTEFKKLMDDLDMKLISSHYGIDKDWEKGAAEAAAIGMEYLIVPWLGPQPSLDDYKKAAENFNRLGALCKKNGIRFAYHNHEYTFKQIDGQYPQDVLMQNTDKDLVDYQMDIFWVVTPGEDPSKWFDLSLIHI